MGGANRRPDLLERAPVIRRALVAEEPAAVGLLEPDVHLEPAVVGSARIRPTALVAVDAEPVAEIWRVRRPQPRPMGAVPPAPFCSEEPRYRACSERARHVPGWTPAHHRQP